MPLADGYNRSGVASPSMDVPPAQPIPQVSGAPSNYRTVIEDNRWTPTNTMLEHVEGKIWVVDYYSQVIDRDSQLNGQQITSSAVVNQYKKIKELELKVVQDLIQAQDPDTKTMTYAGSALIYSGLIPNEGDMIVAQIGDGQLATFRVTASTKKSVFKNTTYEINYTIGTTDSAYLTDLENKTVATYVFRKDFLTHGQNPIIIETDAALFEDLGSSYARLCQQYFTRFFSRDYMTLVLPGQGNDIYDPFFVSFIKKMFTLEDHYLTQHIRALGIDNDPILKQTNIWDALANVDPSYIDTGFNKAGLVSTSQFSYDPFYTSVRYSGMNYCVYPANPVPGVNVESSILPKQLVELAIVPSNPVGNLVWVPNSNLAILGATNASAIYPVTRDEYYVFSGEFYNQTNNQSGLEAAVRDFLNGGKPNITSIANSAKLFNQWGLLEQFYYVPIVLILIRAVFRTYQG